MSLADDRLDRIFRDAIAGALLRACQTARNEHFDPVDIATCLQSRLLEVTVHFARSHNIDQEQLVEWIAIAYETQASRKVDGLLEMH